MTESQITTEVQNALARLLARIPAKRPVRFGVEVPVTFSGIY